MRIFHEGQRFEQILVDELKHLFSAYFLFKKLECFQILESVE